MKEFNVKFTPSRLQSPDIIRASLSKKRTGSDIEFSTRWYPQDQYTPRNGCDWYIHDKSKIFGTSAERRLEVFNVLNTDFEYRTKGHRSLNKKETFGKDSFKNHVKKVYDVNLRTELLGYLKDMVVYSKLPDRHKEFNGVYQHDCALEDQIFISEIQNNSMFRVYLDEVQNFDTKYGNVRFRNELLKKKLIKINISLCTIDDEDNIVEETVYPITLSFREKTHKDLLFWNGNIGWHYTNPANYGVISDVSQSVKKKFDVDLTLGLYGLFIPTVFIFTVWFIITALTTIV